MKLTTVRLLSLLLLLGAFAAGCNKDALNDAGQAEKQKEQGAVDQRANAIDKMTSSTPSSPN